MQFAYLAALLSQIDISKEIFKSIDLCFAVIVYCSIKFSGDLVVYPASIHFNYKVKFSVGLSSELRWVARVSTNFANYNILYK